MKFRVVLIASLLIMLCLLLAGCAANEETDSSNICTVTFDTGGCTEIAAQKVEKGDRITEPQEPERIGYTFAGWTYQGEPWSFAGYVVSKNMTLTAQWQINTYTVSYILNGGANKQSNPATFTVESTDITLATPTRKGYIFTGWTWEGQTEPQMTVTIPAGTHESKTFTAHWVFDGFDVSEEGALALKADAKRYLPAHLVIPAVFNGIAVTSIGDEAFSGCTGLTSIDIPDSVTNIGYKAFSGCTGLKNIAIPDNVTSIGEGAFNDCTNLQYNTYGNAQYLGNAQNPYLVLIKANATNITSYAIHTSTKAICDSAFFDCTGLSRITIPDSVTNIGGGAFAGCTGLSRITIPDCVTYIGNLAFYGCTGLTSVTIGNGVTSIGSYAFYNCTSLTSITIGNGVTSIGQHAFSGCTGLKNITIPDSVTSIGESAFYKCTGLTSITIPNGVTSIGNRAFYNCTNLQYNTYDNAKYLGNAQNPYLVLIKANATNITSCAIHTSTKAIYNSAFFDCTGLTSIDIPDSVTSIGYEAFSGCTGLKNIAIPDSVTNIGDRAFYNCTNLTYYKYGNARYLGNSQHPYTVLFKAGATSIDFVYIPAGTKIILSFAFSDCKALKSITIPNGVTSIGEGAFYNCTGLTSITIPNGVTSIGQHAFSGCTGLKNITIPDSVTSIGNRAFYNCTGLTSITIPNGVTSIGEGAFYNCKGLTSITFTGTTTQWNTISKGSDWNRNTGTYIVYCNNDSVDKS